MRRRTFLRSQPRNFLSMARLNKVAVALLQIQLGTYCPDVTGAQGGFGPVILPLFQGEAGELVSVMVGLLG